MPASRSIRSIWPKAPLESGIGLANVVKKGQRSQSRAVGWDERTASCLFERTRDGWQMQQLRHDRRDIRHVVQQRMNRHRVIRRSMELPPGYEHGPGLLGLNPVPKTAHTKCQPRAGLVQSQLVHLSVKNDRNGMRIAEPR